MSTSPTNQPRRPWYRLHASTWAVMALALTGMTFWNVAGYYDDSEPRGRRDAVWFHGWPATYLSREVYRDPSLLARRQSMGWEWEPEWSDSLTWRLWERVVSFGIGPLSLDLAIGLTIIAAVATGFECWRRRRAHLLQLYLRELLLVIAVCSASLAFARHVFLAAPIAEKSLRELSNQGFNFGYARGTPECLRVLLPGGDFRPGDRVVSATIHNRHSMPRDIAALSEFRFLEEVHFQRPTLSEDDVAGLCAVPRLKRLRIDVPRLIDDQLPPLARVKTLEELSIGESQLRGRSLADLAALPRLRSLDLDFREAPPGSTTLIPVGKLSQLRRLTLRDRDWRVLTQKEIEAISQLSEVEELTIWGHVFDNSGDPGLLVRSKRKLKSLKLFTRDVPEAIFAALPSLGKLEHLAVSVDHLNAERLAAIGRCRSLRQLKLSSGYLGRTGDEWVKRLATMENLEELDLSDTNVTDAAVDSLATMRSLRRLDLSCALSLTPASIQRLRTVRPDVKVVNRGGPCY